MEGEGVVTAPARFTKADMKRAVSGVVAAGLAVRKVEIDPNGKIVILTGGENRKQAGEGWEDLE